MGEKAFMTLTQKAESRVLRSSSRFTMTDEKVPKVRILRSIVPSSSDAILLSSQLRKHPFRRRAFFSVRLLSAFAFVDSVENYRAIRPDIASIRFYCSLVSRAEPLLRRSHGMSAASWGPLAVYKPDAIVRSTILSRTAHNISHSHHPPTLYRPLPSTLPSPGGGKGKRNRANVKSILSARKKLSPPVPDPFLKGRFSRSLSPWPICVSPAHATRDCAPGRISPSTLRREFTYSPLSLSLSFGETRFIEII